MGYESPLEEENFPKHADAELMKLPWVSRVPGVASLRLGLGPQARTRCPACLDLTFLVSSQTPGFLLRAAALLGAVTPCGH